MSNIEIISHNNNFAPSIFQSLCEFVGDCFGPRYFSSGALLPQKNTSVQKQSKNTSVQNNPRYFSSGATLPQKNTSIQNNHLRFYAMTSKKMVRSYYCLLCDFTLILPDCIT